MPCFTLALILTLAAQPNGGRETSIYQPASINARVQLLATVQGEGISNLSVHPSGRIFLAGTDAILVLEPGASSPRELFRQPGEARFHGLAWRGDDLFLANSEGVVVLEAAARVPAGVRSRRLLSGLPRSSNRPILRFGPDGWLYLTCSDADAWKLPETWRVATLTPASGPPASLVLGGGSVFRLQPEAGSPPQLVATGFGDILGFDWSSRFEPFVIDRQRATWIRRVLPGGDHRLPSVATVVDRPQSLPPIQDLGRADVTCLVAQGDGLLIARVDGGVDRYEPRPDRSSYRSEAQTWLSCTTGRIPIAIAIGHGGCTYLLARHKDREAVDVVRIQEGATAIPTLDLPSIRAEALAAELDSPDFSRRWAAHQEILRRGSPALAGIARRLQAGTRNTSAFLHWVCLAGRADDEESSRELGDLLSGTDSEVKVQAILAFSTRGGVPWFSLWWLFKDPDPRVQLALMESLERQRGRMSLLAQTETMKLGRTEDPMVRHLAARLVARQLEPENPHPLPPDPDEEPPPPPSPRARLAMTLADGFFLTFPPEGKPFSTRNRLVPGGTLTTAEYWRAVGTQADRQAAFRRLIRALDDGWGVIQLQARAFLETLDDPRAIEAIRRFRLHEEP